MTLFHGLRETVFFEGMHTEWETFCLSFIFTVVCLGFNMYVNSDNTLFSLFLI